MSQPTRQEVEEALNIVEEYQPIDITHETSLAIVRAAARAWVDQEITDEMVEAGRAYDEERDKRAAATFAYDSSKQRSEVDQAITDEMTFRFDVAFTRAIGAGATQAEAGRAALQAALTRNDNE